MPGVRKPIEDKIAELDAKIAKHKTQIETLENQKQVLLAPKPLTAKEIIKRAKDKGLTEEDIIKKLGIAK